MTWLAVLAACVLTGCVVVAPTVLRRRRGHAEKALAPPDGVDTRPYDVRASGIQALEALAEQDKVGSSVSASVHETTTAKYAVSLVAKDDLTPADEQAVAMMDQDGLTVAAHVTPREDVLVSREVVLDTGPRVRQARAAHVVPPLKSKG